MYRCMCITSLLYFIHLCNDNMQAQRRFCFAFTHFVIMIGFGTNMLPNSDEDEFRLAYMIWADKEPQPHSANEANWEVLFKFSAVLFAPWGQSIVKCARGSSTCNARTLQFSEAKHRILHAKHLQMEKRPEGCIQNLCDTWCNYSCSNHFQRPLLKPCGLENLKWAGKALIKGMRQHVHSFSHLVRISALHCNSATPILFRKVSDMFPSACKSGVYIFHTLG